MFKYEDCMLKHHVRVNGWLPVCQHRLRLIRKDCSPGHPRRLRYFTFCAVGAVDVLMLDVARVVRQSENKRFDTVVFFDQTQEDVAETQRRIPGAIGFPGEFVRVVLTNDADEPNVLDGDEALASPTDQEDTGETRERQLLLSQRRKFIQHFPFDVINLDLEMFLFKPSDPFPGRVVNALRRLFEWQRRPCPWSNGRQSIPGFSLLFTTQIGPPNLGDDYLGLLRRTLTNNLAVHQGMAQIFAQRCNLDRVDTLQTQDFNLFFKLGMPKVLMGTLMDEDWYVDPEHGIKVFEFERPSVDGPYRMLHLVMDVKRHDPPKEQRGPGEKSEVAQLAYNKVAERLLRGPEEFVSERTIDKRALAQDLEKIKGRRRLYYPEEQ